MDSIISNPVLTLVIPCYNEEEVLPETISRLTVILEELAESQLISKHSKMLFVDDGSRDKTWDIIASYNLKILLSVVSNWRKMLAIKTLYYLG